MSPRERLKAALLSGWFFLMITTLWLLKPIRSASLLSHLGSGETPYVRLGSVVFVGVVVAIYSRVVDRFTRLNVARGASLVFAGVLVVFWAALTLGGEALGSQGWFVWSVFILVDVYSTVMVGIFWTYVNDVVTRDEADKLYGPLGVGGIVGGATGGLIVDVLVKSVGHVNLLMLCAALGVASAALVTATERKLAPPPRVIATKDERTVDDAFAGLRLVAKNHYLLLIVGVVVGYEFASAMTDFVVNVIFERAFTGQDEIAKMFGRLGWIVSGTALLTQLLLVPVMLPRKRIALLIPPIAMLMATIGLAIVPVVAIAFVLSAADRGLNYSLQQVTKETLYVPLTDAEKYKAKAFIDMFVDRAGKALSALALLVVIRGMGVSLEASLAVAGGSLLVWLVSAHYLGLAYDKTVARAQPPPAPGTPDPAKITAEESARPSS